jgi:hypothetical protein
MDPRLKHSRMTDEQISRKFIIFRILSTHCLTLIIARNPAQSKGTKQSKIGEKDEIASISEFILSKSKGKFRNDRQQETLQQATGNSLVKSSFSQVMLSLPN